jgi:transcriptional regulator of acetoin/glycerol metabolism
MAKRLDHLLDRIPPAPGFHRESGVADLTLASAVRRHIVLVLEYTDGHQQWAADELGIHTTTLYRILRDWDHRRTWVPRSGSTATRTELAGLGV